MPHPPATIPDIPAAVRGACSEPVATAIDRVAGLIRDGHWDAARAQLRDVGTAGEERRARDYLTASLYESQGRFADARAALRDRMEQDPDECFPRYCRLLVLLHQGAEAVAVLSARYEAGRRREVLTTLDALLGAFPGQENLRQLKINLLHAQGRNAQALAESLHLEDFRLDTIARLLSATPNACFNATLDDELARFLEREDFFHPAVYAQIAAELQSRLIRWRRDGSSLENIGRDRLCLAALGELEFWAAETELELTALRKRILDESAAETSQPLLYPDLLLGLAVQVNKTEYAWHEDGEETGVLDDADKLIRGQLARETPDTRAILVPLLLTLMYRDPLELDYAPRLAAAGLNEAYPPVIEFVASILERYAEESRLAERFAAQGRLRDAVSHRVAAMYESAPYPRYLGGIPVINPQRRLFTEAWQLHEAPAFRCSAPRAFRTILIAGCGTGLHPISIAEGFPWMQVTAIDISARSLAYAQMMAERRGVTNLSFRRCDILDVGDLEAQFDIVEAVGVLHHMRDPEAGLRALLGCLRTGGLIKLGLYSRAGRQAVIRFRRRNPSRSTQLDAAAVRRIRRRVLTAPAGDETRDLLHYRDFYSLSGVRDLILHEQELQFSIPELAGLLDAHGLNFVSFVDRGGIHEQLRSAVGADADPYDLRHWEEAESKLPSLFAGMYVFFARHGTDRG